MCQSHRLRRAVHQHLLVHERPNVQYGNQWHRVYELRHRNRRVRELLAGHLFQRVGCHDVQCVWVGPLLCQRQRIELCAVCTRHLRQHNHLHCVYVVCAWYI